MEPVFFLSCGFAQQLVFSQWRQGWRKVLDGDFWRSYTRSHTD